MDKELIDLLEEYVEKVNSIKPIMLHDFNVKTKKELIEKRLSFTIGELKISSNNRYRFHGRGCNFSNHEFEIDWDFGCYEIWCGINPGLFLHYLSTHYEMENNVFNYNKIEKFIIELAEDDILVKRYGLYYFVENTK